MAMERVIIVGLGGIGGALAEPLARYLCYSGTIKELWLVDGDRYERRNAERQKIGERDVGRSKAEVWAERLQGSFPGLKVRSASLYLTPQSARELLPNRSVVMLCVDNHATRNLAQSQVSKLREVVLISGGNDYTDGNVQVFVKRGGKALSAPITRYHPEIEFPRDRRPDEVGCDELVAEAPQLLFANLTAAVLMLNALYQLLREGVLQYNEVYFDLVQNRARAVARP
jgi:molybdopterin/thiamine biosynthesis adenylyltransferase